MNDLASALLLTLAILRVPFALPEVPEAGCNLAARELTGLLEDPERRVRALTPRMADVLQAGARRSPTFLRLLRALQQKDVIVQILDEPTLRSTPAQLLIVPVGSGTRFVRVQVGNRRGGDDLVALVGHELFHALEIAREPNVRDPATLQALYRRIGFGTNRVLQYDTDAAIMMERRIRRELGSAGGCDVASSGVGGSRLNDPRLLDLPREAECLERSDADPVQIQLVPGEPVACARGMGVVIVVPPLAERQQRDPPVVG